MIENQPQLRKHLLFTKQESLYILHLNQTSDTLIPSV